MISHSTFIMYAIPVYRTIIVVAGVTIIVRNVLKVSAAVTEYRKAKQVAQG